jgi:hypothetical protein
MAEPPIRPSAVGRHRSSVSFQPRPSATRLSSQASVKASSPTLPATAFVGSTTGHQPSSSRTGDFGGSQPDLDSPPSTGETTSSFQTSSSDESSPYNSASEDPVVASGSTAVRRELELDRTEEAQRFELGSDAEDEAWSDAGGHGQDDESAAASPFIPSHTWTGRRRRHSRSRRSTTPSSGNLTIFQLTANMLALTLSPTILALPYATYLLSPPLFIPLLCAIAGLAAANHLGLVYVARYLGVKRFEDLGRGFGGGRRTRVAMRVLIILAGLGVLVLYLRSQSLAKGACPAR